MIFASVEVASPTREEIHALIGNAPSLRYLSEMSEGALRSLETQWHKIYIGWHAILGQLKVKQRAEETKTFWGGKKYNARVFSLPAAPVSRPNDSCLTGLPSSFWESSRASPSSFPFPPPAIC